jgi:hypothetical protein
VRFFVFAKEWWTVDFVRAFSYQERGGGTFRGKGTGDRVIIGRCAGLADQDVLARDGNANILIFLASKVRIKLPEHPVYCLPTFNYPIYRKICSGEQCTLLFRLVATVQYSHL